MLGHQTPPPQVSPTDAKGQGAGLLVQPAVIELRARIVQVDRVDQLGVTGKVLLVVLQRGGGDT